MPGIGGEDQVDRDLGVVDAAGGAGVLALDPNGCRALLEVPRLVDDQHRTRVAHVLGHIAADVIADRVLIPHRPAK
jgi:hypothetical protein